MDGSQVSLNINGETSGDFLILAGVCSVERYADYAGVCFRFLGAP